jgi:hypothetical protein
MLFSKITAFRGFAIESLLKLRFEGYQNRFKEIFIWELQ